MTRKKLISLILVFGLAVSSCFTGCGSKSSNESFFETVLKFNNEDITLGEVYLYALIVQNYYEASYGQDIWNLDIMLEDGNTSNMEKVTREDIINDIIRVKMLVVKAGEMNITLTDNETTRANDQAGNFWNLLTDEQVADMQLSETIVNDTFLENALAKKVYDQVLTDGNIEVSDEDARETTFYDMYFECFKENSDGSISPLSKDEKKVQYEKALQAYTTLIDPVGDSEIGNIEGLAEYYGLSNSSYYTMTPDEINEIYGEKIAKDIYNLQNGSYSLVTETEYGYHIFFMKALTDEDATRTRKNELTTAKKKAYMETKYDKWLSEIDKNYSYESRVDRDVYSRIILDEN